MRKGSDSNGVAVTKEVDPYAEFDFQIKGKKSVNILLIS
jgi:hypothetical protein